MIRSYSTEEYFDTMWVVGLFGDPYGALLIDLAVRNYELSNRKSSSAHLEMITEALEVALEALLDIEVSARHLYDHAFISAVKAQLILTAKKNVSAVASKSAKG